MPRHFLVDHTNGLTPEKYFGKVQHSDAHDVTISLVVESKVDIGAVNSNIFRRMIKEGRITEQQLKVVWETPPYVDYVWAVPAALSKESKRMLRNAFLALTPTNDEHLEILKTMNSMGFLPASDNQFVDLEKIAQRLGLLK